MEVEDAASETNSSVQLLESRSDTPLASSMPVPDYLVYKFEESDEDMPNVRMRQGLTAALKEIYESEAEFHLVEKPDWRLTKQLYLACKKMYSKNQEKNLINELVLRLNFIMDDSEKQDDRLRVLISLVVVAIRLHFEHLGDLLAFLFDFAARKMEADNIHARANGTRLMGFIFKYWVAEPVYFDDEEGVLSMPEELMAELYARMLAIMTDKIHSVRQALIFAVADFQEMPIPNSCKEMLKRSPKEVIMAFFQDFNPGNQMAAILKINNQDSNPIILNRLAHTAGGSPHMEVKKEALRRLGEVPVGAFPAGLAQEILFSALNDPCEEIILYAKTNVITPWISLLARECAQDHGYANGRMGASEDESHVAVGQALIMFLDTCDIMHHTELCDQITFAALEMSRYIIHKDKKLTPAELAVYMTAENDWMPRIYSRFNKELLWDEKSTCLFMSTPLYLWRCMVQYGVETTAEGCRDVAGHDHVLMREEVLLRLAPTLVDMVNVVERLYKRYVGYTTEDGSMDEDLSMYWNFVVSESMKICNFLEKEPFGLASWKELVQEMVLNTNASKMLTDQMGEVIASELYAENPEVFIFWFLNRIDFDATCAFDENDQNQNPGSSTQMDYGKSIQIISFTMQILHGVLSTGKVNTNTDFFREILNRIQTKCFNNVTDEARPWMIKAATSIMLSNERLCRENIQWFLDLLNMERLEDRAAGLTCLYDVVKIFSSKKVDKWRKAEKENSFPRLLAKMTFPPDEIIEPDPLHYAACEVACKYMLLSDGSIHAHRDNCEVVLGLFLSYFLPNCRVNRRENIMIKKFVMIYMQQSSEHRGRLVLASLACIKRMIGSFLKNAEGVMIHDIERMMLATENWFTASVLIDEPPPYTAENYRFEPNFMFLYFYSSIWNDYAPYDPVLELLLHAISRLNYSAIPKQLYHSTERYFQEIMKTTCQEYGAGHPYTKKVLSEWNRLRSIRNRLDEAEDGLGELQSTSRGTRGRGRRTPAGSTRKPTSIQKFAPTPRLVSFEEGQEPPPEPAELRAQQFPRRGRNVRKRLVL